jgi:hypothetical protein
MARPGNGAVGPYRLQVQPVTEFVLLVASLRRHPHAVEVVDVGEDLLNLVRTQAIGEQIVHVDHE